jgi:RNA polymerase sigma-70 factor (ECF subfamily)
MGYSCEEIAGISDCPVNTVKTRLFHAREQMRTLLPNLAGGALDDSQRTTA